MRDIVFDNRCKQFTFKDKIGNVFCFDYYPSIEGLWDDLNNSDFDVQLLIHPFLNKESNVFTLVSNIKSSNETVGFVFPVSVLDSDNYIANRFADNNYFFVAYRVLLERLDEIKGSVNSLAGCFEDNVCICILNLRTIGKDQGISNCIHSLRKYGYSYFVEKNNYKPIEGYTIDMYKDILNDKKKIPIRFFVPQLYSDPVIDGIMKSLPKADNLIYRFILLYQIIEFLIAKNTSDLISSAITNYNSNSCTENDFIEIISNARKERDIIRGIWNNRKLSSMECGKMFVANYKLLYKLTGLIPMKNSEDCLLYSFRNQIVHSYRHFTPYMKELAITIFYFEQVVLMMAEDI